MNSIARMYPNLSASELSNIILKGKGKSRKYFHHNPTQIPAGALEVDAVFAQSFTRHMVGEGTSRNAIQDRLFFFRSRKFSFSLCHRMRKVNCHYLSPTSDEETHFSS